MTIKEFLEDAAARLDYEATDNLPSKAEMLDALNVLYESDCVEMTFDHLAFWCFGASGYVDSEEIRAFCNGVEFARRAARPRRGCAGKVETLDEEASARITAALASGGKKRKKG